MRNYQIVFNCPKTKETKIINKGHYSFARATSFSYVEVRRLGEQTGEEWLVAAIYDIDFKFKVSEALS